MIIPQSFCHGSYDAGNNQQVICDDDRFDLRQGLNFYLDLPDDQRPRLSGIYSDIMEAFRYRSRFQNRSGIGLGFTPAICDPATDNLRYCYSPAQIEKIRERVDCLQWIYNGGGPVDPDAYLDALTTEELYDKAKTQLELFMRSNFGVTYVRSANNTTPVRKDGFEKLYAELLIMLGQEAYTNALRARLTSQASVALLSQANFETEGIGFRGLLFLRCKPLQGDPIL